MPNPHGRPKVDDPIVIRKSVKFNQSMIDIINKYAKDKGLSFGEVIRLCVRSFFEKIG